MPPAWFRSPRPKLPVVVLLPGEPSQTDDWTRAGFADVRSDAYAKEHGGMAPIVVMADENGSITNDTECVDGKLGKVEQDLTAHEPSDLLRAHRYPQLGGWFEVSAAQKQLVPLARAAGIATCAVTIPGGEHTFPVWAQAFRDSLPWMAGRLGITRPLRCPDG